MNYTSIKKLRNHCANILSITLCLSLSLNSLAVAAPKKSSSRAPKKSTVEAPKLSWDETQYVAKICQDDELTFPVAHPDGTAEIAAKVKSEDGSEKILNCTETLGLPRLKNQVFKKFQNNQSTQWACLGNSATSVQSKLKTQISEALDISVEAEAKSCDKKNPMGCLGEMTCKIGEAVTTDIMGNLKGLIAGLGDAKPVKSKCGGSNLGSMAGNCLGNMIAAVARAMWENLKNGIVASVGKWSVDAGKDFIHGVSNLFSSGSWSGVQAKQNAKMQAASKVGPSLCDQFLKNPVDFVSRSVTGLMNVVTGFWEKKMSEMKALKRTAIDFMHCGSCEDKVKLMCSQGTEIAASLFADPETWGMAFVAGITLGAASPGLLLKLGKAGEKIMKIIEKTVASYEKVSKQYKWLSKEGKIARALKGVAKVPLDIMDKLDFINPDVFLKAGEKLTTLAKKEKKGSEVVTDVSKIAHKIETLNQDAPDAIILPNSPTSQELNASVGVDVTKPYRDIAEIPLVDGKRTGVEGLKENDPNYRRLKEDLVVKVDPNASPEIKKAADKLTDQRKASYQKFNKTFEGNVPPTVQKLADKVHNVPTYLDEGKTVLNPKKAEALAELRKEMQATLISDHRSLVTDKAKQNVQKKIEEWNLLGDGEKARIPKPKDWSKLNAVEKNKKITTAAADVTQTVLKDMKEKGVLGADAFTPSITFEIKKTSYPEYEQQAVLGKTSAPLSPDHLTLQMERTRKTGYDTRDYVRTNDGQIVLIEKFPSDSNVAKSGKAKDFISPDKNYEVMTLDGKRISLDPTKLESRSGQLQIYEGISPGYTRGILNSEIDYIKAGQVTPNGAPSDGELWVGKGPKEFISHGDIVRIASKKGDETTVAEYLFHKANPDGSIEVYTHNARTEERLTLTPTKVEKIEILKRGKSYPKDFDRISSGKPRSYGRDIVQGENKWTSKIKENAEYNFQKTKTNALAPGEKVDINTASKEDLMRIPGVGKARAEEIIKRREQALFTGKEDIKRANGIKDKNYQKIEQYIEVKDPKAAVSSNAEKARFAAEEKTAAVKVFQEKRDARRRTPAMEKTRTSQSPEQQYPHVTNAPTARRSVILTPRAQKEITSLQEKILAKERQLSPTGGGLSSEAKSSVRKEIESLKRTQEKVKVADEAKQILKSKTFKLNDRQADAIAEAHLVGRGELGADGIRPAGIGNYTKAQIRKKAEIMRDGGVPMGTRRQAMKKGIAGDHLPEQGHANWPPAFESAEPMPVGKKITVLRSDHSTYTDAQIVGRNGDGTYNVTWHEHGNVFSKTGVPREKLAPHSSEWNERFTNSLAKKESYDPYNSSSNDHESDYNKNNEEEENISDEEAAELGKNAAEAYEGIIEYFDSHHYDYVETFNSDHSLDW